MRMSIQEFLQSNGYTEVQQVGGLFLKPTLKRLGESNPSAETYYSLMEEKATPFEVRALIRYNKTLKEKLDEYDNLDEIDGFCEGCSL